jgi:MFS family permease
MQSPNQSFAQSSDRKLSPAQARRNVVVCAACCFTGFTGFTLVMPFLPLYISQLGVEDVGQIAMWTGLTLGATPAVTAVSAPFWGRVGDRFGSKILVVRSLTAFVLTKGAMAFVTAPWQLLALRALLGLFAGYGALTVSMAAESVPREDMARAIGFVQMGQRLGPAVGPLIGGVLAPMVGLRRAFLITAAFYLAALLMMVIVYREPRAHHTRGPSRSVWTVFRELLGLPGFAMLLLIVFGLHTVDRSFGPILPLYIAGLGVTPDRVTTIAGILFSVAAVFAAIGHQLAHRVLGYVAPKQLITLSAVTTAAVIASALLMPGLWTITLALAVAGTAIGLALTAVYTIAGGLLPSDAHVTGFSILTTAALIGFAVSPVVAGFVGSSGLRIVFLLDVILLVVLAVIVGLRMRSAPVRPTPAVPSDASVT